MRTQMLHVFRNTPTGRENLLQAIYFCQRQFGLSLSVYIPAEKRFVMQFDSSEVMVDLDSSYIEHPETARQHAEELLESCGVAYQIYEPEEMADAHLPLVGTDWAVMSCPRAISEKSSRIGIGHIGPKVRGIVKHAPFPVFIPSMGFKPWKSVSIFFGGSQIGTVTVMQGVAQARFAQMPFTIYTQLSGVTREECEKALEEVGMAEHLEAADANWVTFDKGTLEENLYDVPHDSLAVVGAAGHRLITELIFGSKLEVIQSTLTNPLLVVGPHCRCPSALANQDEQEQGMANQDEQG